MSDSKAQSSILTRALETLGPPRSQEMDDDLTHMEDLQLTKVIRHFVQCPKYI